MGETTKIPYVHHTFNPWWGCCPPILDRPGCLNCYARAMDHRLGMAHWGRDAPRRLFSDKHWAEPLKWDAAARAAGQRARVLCGSMCDWLEQRRDLVHHRRRLLTLIDATPSLDWLLLSKRLENWSIAGEAEADTWPKNAWLGATVENKTELDGIAPILGDVAHYVRPAVLFISAEPLLGPIDFTPHLDLIDWLIVGGESGPHGRPMHPEWPRRIRDAAAYAGKPFYFKQWGAWCPFMQCTQPDAELCRLRQHRFDDDLVAYRIGTAAGRTLDGREHLEIPQPVGAYHGNQPQNR